MRTRPASARPPSFRIPAPARPASIAAIDAIRRKRMSYPAWSAGIMKVIAADPSLKRLSKDRKEQLVAMLAFQPQMSTARVVAVAQDPFLGTE